MTDILEHFGHQFWSLDIIGIEFGSKGNENQRCKVKTEVVKKFNESISFENDRYVVRLPWKPDQKEKLMYNKALAIKRADNLKNRLGKNPSLESRYNAVLHDLGKKGIVYKVPVDELTTVFYLPYRPVVRKVSTQLK